MTLTTASIHRWTAHEIVAAVASGRTTCEAVTRACLEHIAAREPEVGAWAHIDFEHAIAQARALDRSGRRGALLGVPVGVKDIIDTCDMPTAYGSPIYAGHRPRRDAACVALSRRAGAIVMGKTVTAEFAVVHPGKTVHPLDPARTPGGSSSGSAAAVADDMVPLALGTQTTGSTIKPASYCGVFGYRPTFGDIRCSGVMESAASCDTVGLYARSVEDIALYRDVLVDVAHEPVPDDLPAPRIGWCRTPQWSRLDPSSHALFEDAVTRLAHSGADIAEEDLPADFARVEEEHRLLSSYEFALNFTWEIAQHAEELSSALREGKVKVGLACSFERYRAARTFADRMRREIDRVFDRYDVLLAPAATGEAPVGTNTGDSSLCSSWTLMHVPTMSVPAFTGPAGLPVGAQVIAARNDDRRLFAAARWIHRRLQEA
jgi:Asp-tRNA(Asn)/Glu-tRNA(Gln) amidotransferase A subunit family amidase